MYPIQANFNQAAFKATQGVTTSLTDDKRTGNSEAQFNTSSYVQDNSTKPEKTKTSFLSEVTGIGTVLDLIAWTKTIVFKN